MLHWWSLAYVLRVRLCFLFVSCRNLCIRLVSGAECSHSFSLLALLTCSSLSVMLIVEYFCYCSCGSLVINEPCDCFDPDKHTMNQARNRDPGKEIQGV